MIYRVTLSNGKIITLTEQDDALAIGMEDGGEDWWMGTITPDGMVVASSSGSAPADLVLGLADTSGLDPGIVFSPGDQVHWTDPDGGKCSRTLTIQSIEWKGSIARIIDTDGGELECFANELS